MKAGALQTSADHPPEAPRASTVHTTIVTLLSRSSSILGLLLVTPLLTRGLGPEGYGVLATIASITLLVSLADLGVGNGLITHLAQHPRKSRAATDLVADAWFSMLVLGAGCLVALGVLTSLMPWPRLFPTEQISQSTVGSAVSVGLLLSAFAIPTSLGVKVEIARQRTHKVALWTSVSVLSGPVAVAILAQTPASLVWCVALYIGLPILVLTAHTVIVLRAEGVPLRPEGMSVPVLRACVARGFPFLGISLIGAVAFNLDTLLISAFLGSGEAGEFNVTLRVFGVVGAILQMAFMQLWGAFAQAWSQGRYAWVRQTLIRATVISVVVGVLVQGVLVVVAHEYMAHWLGVDYRPSWALLILAAIWFLYSLVVQPLSMFLNGAGLEKAQFLVGIPGLAVNIVVSLYLTHQIGAPGPLIGNLVSNALLIAPVLIVLAQREFRRVATEEVLVR